MLVCIVNHTNSWRQPWHVASVAYDTGLEESAWYEETLHCTYQVSVSAWSVRRWTYYQVLGRAGPFFLPGHTDSHKPWSGPFNQHKLGVRINIKSSLVIWRWMRHFQLPASGNAAKTGVINWDSLLPARFDRGFHPSSRPFIYVYFFWGQASIIEFERTVSTLLRALILTGGLT